MCIPTVKGVINAVDRKDAIDQAIRIWRLQIDKIVANGDVYRVPEICVLAEKRDGMKELGNEMPLKPSRWGRKKR